MQTKEIVASLIKSAIVAHTSDIFLFPKPEKYQLSFRNNAGLYLENEFKIHVGQEVINFLKYAAQMDISEHRRPQVGAMIYNFDQQDYYLRLSSLGDFNDQESLVIRIIYKTKNSNYFFNDQIDKLVALTQKRGLFITSGPTGSGKTTTMYELAKRVGREKMVMTIEDPVEVHEKQFLQTQVNSEAGIDYTNLLKAALRHRPDILIIGEIRDQGTARLAIDAALSGHLVLATVHAQSTLQTISRLESLGIDTTELLNCLTAISYQRLIPSNDKWSCLLDIAFGSKLINNLERKVRDQFIDWKQNLTLLKKGEKISETDFKLFWQG